MLAVLAIASWPFLNTMLVPWLAVSSVAVGCVALCARGKTLPRTNAALSIVGVTLGGIVLLCWSGVAYVVWSGFMGHPM